MNPLQFRLLVSSAIGWPFTLDICESEDDEDGLYYSIRLTLWGLKIKDTFLVSRGQWYAESGGGIVVNSRETVWQWVAIRFCDMAKDAKQ